MPINGSTRKTRHGTWQARWRDPNGLEKAKNFATEQDARIHLLEVQTAIRQNLYVDSRAGKMLVQDYGAHWLANHHARPSTVTSYGYALERYIYPHLGKKRLDQLDYALLVWWLNALKGTVSPATIHTAHRVLRTMLATGVKTKRLPYNPAIGLPLPPKGKPEWFLITPDQLETLLAEMEEDCPRALVLTAAMTGMRWSELAGLTWENVRFEQGIIRVRQAIVEAGSKHHLGLPKSASSIRDIPMPERVADALLALKLERNEVEGLVFVSERGRPLRRSNWSRMYWDSAKARAGLTLRFHDLRHSYISWLMEAGVDPITVRDLAGHDSITTTEIYSHTNADRKRAAVDRLFGGKP